jgi:dipeptidyl aminopeptidase/acylaminoacyl peptidase
MAENEKAIIFFPNYRGGGFSEGTDEFGRNDVNDIINLYPIFEQYRFCDVDKKAIYGVSRGGMMAYILATKVSWIKTIILNGAHYSMRRMGRERPKLEIMYKEVYNLTKNGIKERSGKYNISRIPKNISFLILHGTADDRVSVSHAYSIGKQCQKEGLLYKLIIFPNGDHGLLNYEKDVLREIDEWITNSFTNIDS